jgi:hypothetical protein
MSGDLSDSRFRWLILQELYELRKVPEAKLDSDLDALYEFVRTQAFKQVREIQGGKKADLALVRLWARRIVRKLLADIQKSLSGASRDATMTDGGP